MKGENMSDKRLTPRKLQILKAIVDAHIENGDPVGSRYLSEMTELTCSSATIRNEMAELESMGYLVQPHTSAGRIPSEMGYRLYVDSLIHQYSTTRQEIDLIRDQLRCKLTEMDEILAEASRLASSFSDYTGIAFKSGEGSARVNRFASVCLGAHEFLLVLTFEGEIVKTKTVHTDIVIDEESVRRLTEALNLYLVNLTGAELTLPLSMKLEALMGAKGGMVHPAMRAICEAMNELDSDDVRLEGITKLLQYPEYSDMSRFRGLLGVLEEKEKLMDVISNHTTEDDGIHVYIGTEREGDVMQGTTLIFKNVRVGNSRVAVGVIGPKRMNYSKVITLLNGLASSIDSMYSSEETGLLPGLEEDF